VTHAELKPSYLKALKAELERMKKLTGLGLELDVVWNPCADKPLLGEIKDNVIYIYEVSLENAVNVLRHEFVDYCVSKAIEPYRATTNNLIRSINDGAYRQKERVVEALMRLLFERQTSD
jgi:hypothetical protein